MACSTLYFITLCIVAYAQRISSTMAHGTRVSHLNFRRVTLVPTEHIWLLCFQYPSYENELQCCNTPLRYQLL